MPTFYVQRTSAAYVTEITKIEAENADVAQAEVENGGGDFVGLHVGDYVPFLNEATTETLPAEPCNLPFPMYYPEK